MNTAILFSGQGTQYSGMGAELVGSYASFIKIFDTGSHILGYDLAKMCFMGEDYMLSRTEISQPAIFATSLAAFEAAKALGISFSAVAGHSLGEYAAMVASGILSLEDGFKVIKARARAMQKASEIYPGGMCAVMGKPAEQIEEVCAGLTEYCVPVNYNSPVQTVIAGTDEGIEEATAVFTAAGAKVIRLNVGAAFHSRMMEPAAEEFYREIKDIRFNAPTCRFYSNVLGEELTDFSDIANMLAQHMISPVRFTSELSAMNEDGYNVFVECGPGRVLTGLVRKTLKDVKAMNIENNESLDKAVEAYSALIAEEEEAHAKAREDAGAE